VKTFTDAVTATGALTCYVQDASDELATAGTRPAVLILPGGGYFFCSDREAEPIALAYLAEGFNAFVLRYAAGAEVAWDRSFADARAGLAWIRDRSGDLGIDPGKVAAVGFSAGGHLAASLGTATEHPPDALVLGYPVTLAEFGPALGKELLDTVDAVSARTPPAFVFHTWSDNVVPIRNSLAFLVALAEHGVPFESHLYLLGEHGLSLAKATTANGRAGLTDPVAARWFADSVGFLHRVFGDFAVTGEAETYQQLLERRRFGLDTPLGRLLADQRAVAVLESAAPGLVTQLRAHPAADALSLRGIAGFRPELAESGVLAALEERLAELNA